MKLTEGMRSGDLEDLVLPLISVDEYESKVSDDAVVIAFYVHDHDAAHDLNRFIQKSPVMILDTDVSPAPDQRGYYLVFFELLNNERLGENVGDILDEVSPLTKIDNWQMRIRSVDEIMSFSQQAVDSHFKKAEEEVDEVSEAVMEYLTQTTLESVAARNGKLVMEGFGFRDEYEIIEFGPIDNILRKQDFTIGAEDVGMAASAASTRITRRLGEGWSVSRVNGMSLLSRADSENALLLKSK